MKNQSLTITGLIVTLLSFFSQQLDLGLPNDEINTLVMSTAQVIGIAIAWYGRVRKGDVNLIGKRK